MDEMVLLCHSTRKPASSIPKSVRVVYFSTQEEILGLLGVSQATKSQSLRAEAAVFVPSHQQLRVPEAVDGLATTKEPVVASLEHEEAEQKEYEPKEDEHEQGEDGQEDDGKEDDEQEDDGQEDDGEEEEILEAENDHEMDVASTTDIPLSLDAAPQPSEEEIHAALVIQRMYKHLHRRRRHAGKLNQSRNHHFNACLARSKTLSFRSLRYRLMFLGTLPHLLVCIEAVHTRAHEAKTKHKRSLHAGKNDVLVESGKRLTRAVYVPSHPLARAMHSISEIF
jgi:transcriptional regulator with XRE-family HTH domain